MLKVLKTCLAPSSVSTERDVMLLVGCDNRLTLVCLLTSGTISNSEVNKDATAKN